MIGRSSRSDHPRTPSGACRSSRTPTNYVGLGQLDTAATVSLISFAVALPLLAAPGVLNALQAGYRYHPFPWWMTLAVVLALGASVVGIVAAFWHVSAIAAVVVIATGSVCGALLIAYRSSLDKANPNRDAELDSSAPRRSGKDVQ